MVEVAVADTKMEKKLQDNRLFAKNWSAFAGVFDLIM